MHYETLCGQVTQGLNFSKMLDLLRELQEATATQGHLVRMQGDSAKDNALADGWLVISENLKMMERFIITMAQGKLLP